jgi:hypothetical protein
MGIFAMIIPDHRNFMPGDLEMNYPAASYGVSKPE